MKDHFGEPNPNNPKYCRKPGGPEESMRAVESQSKIKRFSLSYLGFILQAASKPGYTSAPQHPFGPTKTSLAEDVLMKGFFGILMLLSLGASLLTINAEAQGQSSTANPVAASAAQSTQGALDIKVWVNTASGVYHCPGTRWYGATKQDEYMTQAEAQKKMLTTGVWEGLSMKARLPRFFLASIFCLAASGYVEPM